MDEGFSAQSFINEIPWVCLLFTTPSSPSPEKDGTATTVLPGHSVHMRKEANKSRAHYPDIYSYWAVSFKYPWQGPSPSDSQCIIGHVQNNYLEQSINLLQLKVDWFSQGTLLVCQEFVLVPGIGKLFRSSADSKHAFTPHFFNSYFFKVKLANYFKSWMN